jgi:hypothetical protein
MVGAGNQETRSRSRLRQVDTFCLIGSKVTMQNEFLLADRDDNQVLNNQLCSPGVSLGRQGWRASPQG